MQTGPSAALQRRCSLPGVTWDPACSKGQPEDTHLWMANMQSPAKTHLRLRRSSLRKEESEPSMQTGSSATLQRRSSLSGVTWDKRLESVCIIPARRHGSRQLPLPTQVAGAPPDRALTVTAIAGSRPDSPASTGHPPAPRSDPRPLTIPFATTSPPPAKSATTVSTLAGERLERRSHLLALNRNVAMPREAARSGHGEAARAIPVSPPRAMPVWQQDVASFAGFKLLISNRLKSELHQKQRPDLYQAQRPAAGLSPRAGYNL